MGCRRLPESGSLRAALCAAVLGLALSACGHGTAPAACGGGAQACGSDADCGGFTCTNGCCGTTPAQVCNSDADCTNGGHCNGGTCTTDNGTGSGSCGSNADCANNANGLVTCDLAGTQTCVECVKASDCKTPAKTCTNKKCVDVPSGCASDADCAHDPAGSVCKLTTHKCVACVGNQNCSIGQVCVQNACVAANGACQDNTSCADPTPICNSASHQCVACTDDSQCPAGKKCSANACVDAGCSADADCAANAAAPKCNTATHACVACNATADCNDPTLACQAHACVPAQTGCTADSGCSGSTPHCDTTAHQCVACVNASQCPANNDCTGGACVPHVSTGCTSDAACATHAGTPKCDTASGNCVACLSGADCPSGLCDATTHACQAGCAADANCAAPTAKCDTSAHQCVACLAASDCGAGQICTAGSCVAGCSADADCATSAAGKKCLTTSHQCVACLATADCASGQTCTQNACVPTSTGGGTDPACGTNDACPTGSTCISSADGTTKTCRTTCDPYNPGATCGTTKVCAWVGFTTQDQAAGACLPKNGQGAAGTVCQSGADCENDLLCLPSSATQKTCAKLCNPQNGTCGSGQSCHGLPAYEDPTTGDVLPIGACLATTSNFGAPCSSDFSKNATTGATTPDCGTGETCGPNNLLADDSIRVSMCQFPYGTGQASAACTDGASCITGDCLGGPKVCNTSCHWTSDCQRAGLSNAYKCLPYPWFGTSPYTGNVNLSETGACLPTCKSDAGCAPDRFCMLTPTFENSGNYISSFYSFCYMKLGDPSGPLKGPGQRCTQNADCESGSCVTNGKTGATDGYCFGSCDPADKTQCDPAHGVGCDPAGVGLQLNDGPDGQPGTQDDQFGRAYVCGGTACSSDADCAGFSADSTKARTCRLTFEVDGSNSGFGAPTKLRTTCEPRVGSGKAGTSCTSDSACRSGTCLQISSSSTTKVCLGGCSTDSDCATGTTCQTYDFSAANDGTNLIDVCSP